MTFEQQLVSRYSAARQRLMNPHPPKPPLKIIPKVKPPAVLDVIPNLSPVKLAPVKAEQPEPQYTLARLCEWVSDLEGVSVDHIKSILRNPTIVRPRMIFYHLAYNHSQGRFSSADIARFVSKDHTSVLSGIKRIAHLRQSDRGLDHRLSQYEEYLVYKTVKTGDNCLCSLCPYR